jgi:hypothetical protein
MQAGSSTTVGSDSRATAFEIRTRQKQNGIEFKTHHSEDAEPTTQDSTVPSGYWDQQIPSAHPVTILQVLPVPVRFELSLLAYVPEIWV